VTCAISPKCLSQCQSSAPTDSAAAAVRRSTGGELDRNQVERFIFLGERNQLGMAPRRAQELEHDRHHHRNCIRFDRLSDRLPDLQLILTCPLHWYQ
jgi:hypothetical protein